MTLLMAMVVLCLLVACEPKNGSSASFKTLPEDHGWEASMPLEFTPSYSDSNATYDIVVAVRHTNAYKYSNLPLAVDIMSDSTTAVRRVKVSLDIADDYGNWHGTGFGTIYQCKAVVARHVAPATAKKVIIWQVIADTTALTGISEVGVITSLN